MFGLLAPLDGGLTGSDCYTGLSISFTSRLGAPADAIMASGGPAAAATSVGLVVALGGYCVCCSEKFLKEMI